MAKPAKPAADAAEAPPKSKKLLVIIIAVLVLVVGGAAAFFLMSGGHGGDEEHAKEKAVPKIAKTVPLEPFTVNLQREEGDQFLQVGVTLEFYEPALEEEIKGNMPRIRSRVLLLLSGKKASELSTIEGKEQLKKEILAACTEALGLNEGEHAEGKKGDDKKGITDVLFTSFIIQ